MFGLSITKFHATMLLSYKFILNNSLFLVWIINASIALFGICCNKYWN